MFASDNLRAYRRARKAFSTKVYGLLIVWLILGLIQWIIVCIIEDARSAFQKFYYIPLIAFALAVLLLAIFIFALGLRFKQILNFIISLIIVELQIIATLVLVAHSWWAEVLVFLVVCAVLIFLFLLIGVILPKKVDLTLNIAVLFIMAFIFLIVAVFVLALLVCLWFPMDYTYLVVEIAVTLTILLFVIYHAQTIHGNRFAEMRLHDFFLGSLILFHDFLIIFWLTFYWQIQYRPITPENDSRMLTTVHDKSLDALTLGTIYTEQPWDDGRSEEYGVSYEPEDQDEDSSQHRHVTGNRIIESWGKDRRNQRKHKLRTTPIDWSAFKEINKASDDVIQATTEESLDDLVHTALEIRKPVEGFMRYGVLYKAAPVDGRKFPDPPIQVNEFGDNKVGSEIEYLDAKGKPKSDFGAIQSTDFSLAPQNSTIDWSGLADLMTSPPEEPREMLYVNKTILVRPLLAGDEMPGQKGAEKPLTDFYVLSQEELKSLSDPKVLREKERVMDNPRAEPLTTSRISVQTPLPDFQKLVMNDTLVAN